MKGLATKRSNGSSSIWQQRHSAEVGALAENGFEARLGMLDVKLVKEWDLEGSVQAGSLNVLPEKLGEDAGIVKFKPFSQFPPAV